MMHGQTKIMFFSSGVSLVILGAASCSSHGRSSKIKNVSEYTDTKCKEIMFQGNSIIWGEHSGVPREGALEVLQPKKPMKLGFCIYCLCDSTNDGHILLMLVTNSQFGVSRFTIHLLNCYSFGANVAVADWWYMLPCFCGQILHQPSVGCWVAWNGNANHCGRYHCDQFNSYQCW